MSFFIGQVICAIHNYLNCYIDAYKITKLKKDIRHGINLIAYIITVAAIIWITGGNLLYSINFAVSVFIQRQFTFDIPLNINRGLPWDYQSTAEPPKAFLDKVERKVFGKGDVGRKIAIWYLIFYCITIGVQCVIK